MINALKTLLTNRPLMAVCTAASFFPFAELVHASRISTIRLLTLGGLTILLFTWRVYLTVTLFSLNDVNATATLPYDEFWLVKHERERDVESNSAVAPESGEVQQLGSRRASSMIRGLFWSKRKSESLSSNQVSGAFAVSL
jgi:hypothetical protein